MHQGEEPEKICVQACCWLHEIERRITIVVQGSEKLFKRTMTRNERRISTAKASLHLHPSRTELVSLEVHTGAVSQIGSRHLVIFEGLVPVSRIRNSPSHYKHDVQKCRWLGCSPNPQLGALSLSGSIGLSIWRLVCDDVQRELEIMPEVALVASPNLDADGLIRRGWKSPGYRTAYENSQRLDKNKPSPTIRQ